MGCAAYALTRKALARPRSIQAVALEVGAIWVAAALLPPLLAFVAYFCLLHSQRQVTETLAVSPRRKDALWSAAAIMVVSLCGAVLGLALLAARAPGDVTGAVLQTVFIGLAALTVPHMLLVQRFSVICMTRRE